VHCSTRACSCWLLAAGRQVAAGGNLLREADARQTRTVDQTVSAGKRPESDMREVVVTSRRRATCTGTRWRMMAGRVLLILFVMAATLMFAGAAPTRKSFSRFRR
jgi:hypothetical protein